MEIEVGKKYVVGNLTLMQGDVIKITGFDGENYRYETVERRGRYLDEEGFHKNSIMANSLTPWNGNERIDIVRTPDGEEMKSVTLLAESETLENVAKKGLSALFGRENNTVSEKMWEQFDDGNVYVQVNRSNVYKFLCECFLRGYFWKSGEPATSVNPFKRYDSMGEIARAVCESVGIGLGENIYITAKDGYLAFELNKPEGNIFVW